jgi:hypothetical protein
VCSVGAFASGPVRGCMYESSRCACAEANKDAVCARGMQEGASDAIRTLTAAATRPHLLVFGSSGLVRWRCWCHGRRRGCIWAAHFSTSMTDGVHSRDVDEMKQQHRHNQREWFRHTSVPSSTAPLLRMSCAEPCRVYREKHRAARRLWPPKVHSVQCNVLDPSAVC